jgi:CRP-like cAMP-binding protein
VVATGSVEISQAGSHVRDLVPGESFGEIALLRDVPRTATATAAEDVRLWALDRASFLLAITGSPQAVADARARSERILAADRIRA